MNFRTIGRAIGTLAIAFWGISANALQTVAEIEPNNSAATATQLPLNGGRAVATGSITVGDKDFWRIVNVPVNAKIWAYVDTGGTLNFGANSRDSFLTLYASDGTSVIETDDDDGTSNGLDGTMESSFGSAIAGRVLNAGGTYFLSVKESAGTKVVDPYHLYVVVTAPSLEMVEIEPNNTLASSDAIIDAANLIGVRAGSIGVAGDVDFYKVSAGAGDILYLTVDGDPGRTGSGTDVALSLYNFDQSSLLLLCDNSATGSIVDPTAEACGYQISTAGIYYLKVSHALNLTGSYTLMVANMSSQASLDVDASDSPTKHDALTDGLLIIRYLFGLSGTSLTNGALGGTATRTSPSEIQVHLDQLRPTLDIDDNGAADALTDGLLILRYLFGLRGNSLIAGVVGPGAARTSSPAIEAYILSLMP